MVHDQGRHKTCPYRFGWLGGVQAGQAEGALPSKGTRAWLMSFGGSCRRCSPYGKAPRAGSVYSDYPVARGGESEFQVVQAGLALIVDETHAFGLDACFHITHAWLCGQQPGDVLLACLRNLGYM